MKQSEYPTSNENYQAEARTRDPKSGEKSDNIKRNR